MVKKSGFCYLDTGYKIQDTDYWIPKMKSIIADIFQLNIDSSRYSSYFTYYKSQISDHKSYIIHHTSYISPHQFKIIRCFQQPAAIPAKHFTIYQ